MYICIYVYVHVYTDVFIYVYMHIHLLAHVFLCVYAYVCTCICIRNVYIFKFFEPVQPLIFGSITDCTFVARDDVCSRLRVLHRCDGVNVSGVFSHAVHIDVLTTFTDKSPFLLFSSSFPPPPPFLPAHRPTPFTLSVACVPSERLATRFELHS